MLEFLNPKPNQNCAELTLFYGYQTMAPSVVNPVESRQDQPSGGISQSERAAHNGNTYNDAQASGKAKQINGNRGFSEPRQHVFEKPTASDNAIQENGDVGKTAEGTLLEGFTVKVSFSPVFNDLSLTSSMYRPLDELIVLLLDAFYQHC